MSETLTREQLLRKAEQHDNAGFLALSSVTKPSDPDLAAKLWARRDQYLDRARNIPLETAR